MIALISRQPITGAFGALKLILSVIHGVQTQLIGCVAQLSLFDAYQLPQVAQFLLFYDFSLLTLYRNGLLIHSP